MMVMSPRWPSMLESRQICTAVERISFGISTDWTRVMEFSMRSANRLLCEDHSVINPSGSSSNDSRRCTISIRTSGSVSPWTVTHSPNRSSNCGRSWPSSGFIVPTKLKRDGWITLMPSRSTVFTPIAAESSKMSTM